MKNKILKRRFSKIILVAVLFFSLFVFSGAAAYANLEEGGSGINIKTATGDSTINTDVVQDRTFGELVTDIANYFLGFLGFLAVIVFVYAGVLWVIAGGNEETITKSKKIMTYAALGLLVIIMSYAIVGFITGSAGETCESSTDCPDGQECKIINEGEDDEYGICVNAVECETTANCPTGEICVSGTCIETNKCETSDECDDGYICDPITSYCILKGDCHPLFGPKCGTDEICISGKCVLSGACTSSSDCPEDEGYVCDTDEGRCIFGPECEEDGDCPASSGKITYYCNPDYKRCLIKSECTSHSDCGTDEACLSGQCVDISAEGATCDYKGQDGKCPPGFECNDDNKCEFAFPDLPCLQLEDCDYNLNYCKVDDSGSATCEPRTVPGPCTDGEPGEPGACPADYTCEDKEVWNPDSQAYEADGTQCVYDLTSDPCYNYECADGQYCVVDTEKNPVCQDFSFITTACGSDDDCGDRYICGPDGYCEYYYIASPCADLDCAKKGQWCDALEAVCKPFEVPVDCGSDDDCPADYYCGVSPTTNKDTCLYKFEEAPCFTQRCDPGQACVADGGEGTCIDLPFDGEPCGNDSDCPSDYACEDGYCRYQLYPFENMPCSVDPDCPVDYICEDSKCHYNPPIYQNIPCSDDNPCPSSDYTCVDNKCNYKSSGPAGDNRQCEYNEDCSTDQYCSSSGYCLNATVKNCNDDSDCDNGEICHDIGFCYNPDSSVGSYCADRSDCPVGNFVCNPETNRCEGGGSNNGEFGLQDSGSVVDDVISDIDSNVDGIGAVISDVADDINDLPAEDRENVMDVLKRGSLNDKVAGVLEMIDNADDPAELAVLEKVLYTLERYTDLREELDELRLVMPESEDTITMWDRTSEALDSLIQDPLSNLKYTRFLKYYRQLSDLISEFPVVTARIKATPSTGNVPFTVTLDGMDSVDPTGGTITDYKWSYIDNDGNLISLANEPVIIHEFTETNTYAVRLQVSTSKRDAAGYKTAVDGVATILVRANPPASQVAFRINGNDVTDVYHVTTSEAKTGITFDPSITVPALGRVIEKYIWNFGDGREEERSVPSAVVHGYRESGEYLVTLTAIDNHGVKDKSTIKLFIKSLAADVKISPEGGNVNTQFYFEGGGSRSDEGLISTYEWRIEDKKGEIILENKQPDFYHEFTRPGEYKVTLVVTDTSGASDKILKVLDIDSRLPIATFTHNSPLKNHPNRFEFNAANSYDPDEGDLITYSWDFDGDGSFEVVDTQDIRVTHEYKKVGEYKVVLQVMDSFGKRVQSVKTISVNSVLSGDIIPSVSAANVGTDVTFKAQSPNAVAYLWEFGDGETLSTQEETVTYNYPKKGKYRVKLHFFDDDDNSNFDQAYVLIGAADTPVSFIDVFINTKQKAMQDDLCGKGKPGYVVSRTDNILFSGKQSINRDGTGRLLSYSWKLSDGVQSSQKEFSHKFDEVSEYNTCIFADLTVRDQISGKVSDGDRVYFKVANELPSVVDFVVETDGGKELVTPAKIKLKAVAPKDIDGQIKKYRWWYFQKGYEGQKMGVHSTTSPQTEIIVTAKGEPDIINRYYFVLEITDNDNGVYDTYERFGELSSLDIKNGPNLSPVAEFTVDKTTVSVGDSITFVSKSYDPQGDILPDDAYRWDFNGDGEFDDVSSGPQINRQFNTPGEYTIRLKVVYRGLSSSTTKTVYVQQVDSFPQAAFTYDVDGNTVNFNAGSSRYDPSLADRTLRYEWDFDIQDDYNGNGVTDDDVMAQGVTTSFTYSEAGIYRVRLKVKDSLGMENVVVRDVNLNMSAAERQKQTYNSLKVSSPGQPMTLLDISVVPVNIEKGGTADITARVYNADNSPYYGKVYFEILEGSGNFTPNPVSASDSKASAIFTASDSGPVRIRVRATNTYYGDVIEEVVLRVKN